MTNPAPLTRSEIASKLKIEIAYQIETTDQSKYKKWWDYIEYSFKSFEEQRYFDKHLHNTLYSLMEDILWNIWSQKEAEPINGPDVDAGG